MPYRIILWNDEKRALAKSVIDKAPVGARVEIAEEKRSKEQNDKLWPSLTEISLQCRHHGLRLSPQDWKLLFLDQLNSEMRLVPNLNGDGFVNLGKSSSKLSKAEFSALLELIMAYGAAHGVKFNDAEAA